MEVVTLDLTELAGLPSPPFGGREVYLVVTLGEIVLGAGFVAAATGAALLEEVTASVQASWRTRAVVAAVGRPDAWAPPVPARGLAATVGICTRGPSPALARCVTAVRPQLRAGDHLVVVQNGPPADLGLPDWTRTVHEPRPGSGWARNRILAEAATPVLAFVDDDCVPDPCWLDAIRAPFGDAAVGAVTGPVVADRTDLPVPRLMDERYPYHRGWRPLRFDGGTGTDLTPYDSWRVGTGASMAWRTALLDRLHGFDPALGAGTSVGGGEDLDAFRRALDAGATIAYEPAAAVRHEHVRSLRQASRQLRGYARASGAHVAKAWLEDRRKRPLRALAREWRWELAWAGREVVNLATGRPHFPVLPLLLHPALAAAGAVRFATDRGRLRQGWSG